MMPTLIENLRLFYKHDCCWPYAVSFLLTLAIYGIDFFGAGARSHFHWASPFAYGILLAYFLYNVRRYVRGEVRLRNEPFSRIFLSFKIAVWGVILGVLYAVAR